MLKKDEVVYIFLLNPPNGLKYARTSIRGDEFERTGDNCWQAVKGILADITDWNACNPDFIWELVQDK